MKFKKKTCKFLSVLSVFFIVFSCFAFPSQVFAVDTYEYNDFRLFSTSGQSLAGGAFRSNTGGPMSSFGLCINVSNSTWYITGGTATTIPFPSGTSIDYTDRTTFLQNAYYTVNGTRHSFTILSGDDTSGNFYSGSIAASPNYPVVNVYLPVTGTSTGTPSTPVLSVTQDSTLGQTRLSWTPNQTNNQYWYAKVSWKENQSDTPTYISYTSSSPLQIFDVGYYNVCLRYLDEGVEKFSDWSNTVHVTEILSPEEDDPDYDFWWLLQKIDDAIQNIRYFLRNLKGFFYELYDWLPGDVMNVFWAVVIITLIVGVIIK